MNGVERVVFYSPGLSILFSRLFFFGVVRQRELRRNRKIEIQST